MYRHDAGALFLNIVFDLELYSSTFSHLKENHKENIKIIHLLLRIVFGGKILTLNILFTPFLEIMTMLTLYH